MPIRVRHKLGINVFDAAVDRMFGIYREGHRVIVSYSGGKDSTVTLEVCIRAAEMANRLPVEVNFQDDEVMYPGVDEIVMRQAQRAEVKMNWLVCHHPLVNVFNRKDPYYWAFDQKLRPDQWMRQPPAIAQEIDTIDVEAMTDPKRYPPPEGKDLYACIGLRVAESRGRLYGLFSSGSHITKPNALGTRSVRPIFDWSQSDIWKAIKDHHMDYCSAYDVMFRAGMKAERMRVGAPTINAACIDQLQVLSRSWPKWFDRLCKRLPGLRTAAQFGRRAIQPRRRLGETWKERFQRECIDEALAEWLKERAVEAERMMLSNHRAHSTSEFPDASACYNCMGNMGCYKSLALVMYNGDPYSMKMTLLPFVQPSQFRPGARDWTLNKIGF